MSEILNISTQPQEKTTNQYFVKMTKDGTVLEASVVPSGKQEIDQSTMELEYIPQAPTTQEKINYALTLPEIAGLSISEELKKQVAQEFILKSDFEMPVFDPNKSRVHDDPEYFFKTPCYPVVWTFKTGTQEEAIAVADAYRKKMLDSGKWDMVVAVYKQQYNVQEV